MSTLRWRSALLAAVMLAALPTARSAEPAEPVGRAAPLFELPGVDGPVRLERYRGKLVYLDFWASWCAPCKRSFPWMNAMQQQYGAAGLQVVAVNLDARQDDARRFLEATPSAITIAFDPAGAIAKQYGIKGMPSSALIGRDGRLLALHTGFNDADRAALEAQLKASLQQP
ncbi:MAG: TlpA family protein disulfide reductase [Sphingomonadaceae bacterium]